jgi:hypothetical protein
MSDAYGLDSLKFLCEHTLINSVENENVCILLIDGNKFGAQELKRFCLNYIIKNFNDVNKTKGFENLENHPSLLIEVTRSVFSKAVIKEE